MKRVIRNLMGMRLIILTLFVSLLVSCDNDDPTIDQVDVAFLEAEIVADAAYEDADGMVGTAMSGADGGSGGRSATEDDDRISCAQITHNLETKTITIDFGDGCEDPRGNVRAGMIIITYTGPRFLPGSVITTTFEGYSINGIQVEGTRTVENITESLEASPSFRITVTNGKITWPDETFATREVNRVRTWIRAINPINDEFHIEGTASGLSRRGFEYSVVIVEPLVFSKRCFLESHVFIPVSGIKEVTRNGELFVVDFGDGSCDNIVTVTHNGVVREFDLGDRPS